MMIIKFGFTFDICQLSEKILHRLSRFSTNSELANLRKVSRIWNIIIEPHIRHRLINFCFSLSSRCRIPAPIYSLGPIRHLKLAEILDPKHCFFARIQTNNGTVVEFKILKSKDLSNYQLTKNLLPKIAHIFEKIELNSQYKIISYLDEITLLRTSRVSKAWMLANKNHSINRCDDFINFLKGKIISYRRQSYHVRLCNFSSLNRSCDVIISRNYHIRYSLNPTANVQLIDFLETRLTQLISDFKKDENAIEQRQKKELRYLEKASRML